MNGALISWTVRSNNVYLFRFWNTDQTLRYTANNIQREGICPLGICRQVVLQSRSVDVILRFAPVISITITGYWHSYMSWAIWQQHIIIWFGHIDLQGNICYFIANISIDRCMNLMLGNGWGLRPEMIVLFIF